MKIAVVGAGTWGTTLANMLASKNLQVHLWVRHKELLSRMQTLHENSTYLPGIRLSQYLEMSSELQEVLAGTHTTVLAVPSQHLRQVLQKARSSFPPDPLIICATKGIETESCKTVSQLIEEELKDVRPRTAILSGPTFAKEVSRGLPAAAHVGSASSEARNSAVRLLSSPFFKIYPTNDLRGVELGGALKNVIALAAGMSDGIGLGNNARSIFITRGLWEMTRIGTAMGAKAQTFIGLSGIGDLVLTCTGDLSRNRQVGFRLGAGESLQQIIETMNGVAEGIKTARAAYLLCPRQGVNTPVMQQVYQVLYENQPPREALQRILESDLPDSGCSF
ncbi:MAG: NAD(P)H-dependent glycerol-3-phosphate dehydrogenase [Desulfovermiculus sp.]